MNCKALVGRVDITVQGEQRAGFHNLESLDVYGWDIFDKEINDYPSLPVKKLISSEILLGRKTVISGPHPLESSSFQT